MQLKLVNFLVVQHLFAAFQKKSRHFELPPDTAEFLGIYHENVLIGYFATLSYPDGDLDILQGYLKPVFQHKKLSYEAMKLLEQVAKNAGIKRIQLKTARTFKAYTRFMFNLGFKPESILFSKQI